MAARLLFAEPERNKASMVRPQLVAAGFEVLDAEDGNDAWRLIQSQHPDLALMEVALPGLNGLDVLTAIRQDAILCRLPVILLGSPDGIDEGIRGLEAGADRFISHPFSTVFVVAQVQALLRRLKK